ncbi:MAG: hypothetical protein PHV61_09960 [Limnochordia bacterium]|nr:hypothetical protein [Limnochordia bacterium]MDD2630465.1 hypothetical protein [Limnochordia bacterium]
MLPPYCRGAGDEDGFTLLEALAASVVLFLALGSLYSLYIHPLDQLEKGRSAVMAQQKVSMAYGYLSSDLCAALLPTLLHQVCFVGDPQGLSFYTLQNGLPVEVRYIIDSTVGSSVGKILKRLERKLDSNEWSGMTVLSVFDGHFQYYDGLRGAWTWSWNDPLELPSLVRLEYRLQQDREPIVFTFPLYCGRRYSGAKE